MSSNQFWDDFYKKQNKKTFEWLLDSSCLDHIMPLITKIKITTLIDVGCGSSVFTSQISRQLPANLLICADFAIEPLLHLKSLNLAPHIDFIQTNCKQLPIRSDFFDLAIDKGYLDSVLKRLSLVSVDMAMQQAVESVESVLDVVNGLVVQITDEQPELRINLLDQVNKFNLGFHFKEIQIDDYCYFVYFINKKKKY